MIGYRPGSGHWRAQLKAPTAYAPSGIASRDLGNSTSQLVPADVERFYVHLRDKAATPHHMIGKEPGVDASPVKVDSTGRLVSIDPAGFDQIRFIVRHTQRVRIGGEHREMYIVELKKGDAALVVVCVPGETRVQRKLPN